MWVLFQGMNACTMHRETVLMRYIHMYDEQEEAPMRQVRHKVMG